MAERKTINKYYPSNFNPNKLLKPKHPKNKQQKIHTMLPMRVRCNMCGNYMHEGTKFNARKEEAFGEAYLGVVKVFRFYLKCTACCSEFVIKTDPKNSGYVVEFGATQSINMEPRVLKRDYEGMDKKIEDSKRRLDADSRLEELKSMKSRHEKIGFDAMLEAVLRRKREEKDEHDGGDAKKCKVYETTMDVSLLRPVYRKPKNNCGR